MDGLSRTSSTVLVPPWAVRRRFDVTDYYRMAEAGIFGEDDPYELIEGEIIEMWPVGGPQIGTVMALNECLGIAAAGRFRVSIQSPLRLGERNEPEPDVVLLRPRADRYRGKHPPLLEDAVLVVEVADTSLRYDREFKQPLYARHGIPELWIVDVAAGLVEVCRQPIDGAYASVVTIGPAEHVEPLALPGTRIAVIDIVEVVGPVNP